MVGTVEIDPRYGDAIVRRWVNLTGKAAVLAGNQASSASA